MKRWLIIILFLPILCQATMMGTRPLLRGAAQNQVNFDTTKSDIFLCNQALWNEFINRACIQVAVDFDCVEKQLQILTVAGTQSYHVDSALLKALWFLRSTPTYNAPTKHVPVPYMKEFYDDTALSVVQSPRLFWEHEDSVKFYPTPNKVDTFLIGYSIYPAYLNYDIDSAAGEYVASTNIPLEYREAIVFYTCYLFKLLIKEYTEAALLFAEYEKLLIKSKAKDAAKYDLPLRGGG